MPTASPRLIFGMVLPDDTLGVLFEPRGVVAQRTGSNLPLEAGALTHAADPAYSVESGRGRALREVGKTGSVD
jgi:hypothetical protein